MNDLTQGFKANVLSARDFYPFGSELPGRSWNSSNYAYSFNGKRYDSEWNGNTGTIYDYGFRIYDPRVARFLSVDPLTASYPMLTPYQFSSNTPIQAIDLDGLECSLVIYNFSSAEVTKTKIDLPQAGPLGNGVAVKSNKGGADKFYYGEEIPDKSGKSFIKAYEGYKSEVYYDIKQKATIGYGHLIGENERDWYTEGCYISQSEGNETFESDYIANSTVGLNIVKKKYNNLSLNQQDALADIFFNMGPGYAKNFTTEKGGNYFFNYMVDADKELRYRRYAESILYTEGMYLNLREKKGKSAQILNRVFNSGEPIQKIEPLKAVSIPINEPEPTLKTR